MAQGTRRLIKNLNVDATVSRQQERGTSAAICKDEQGRDIGDSVTCFEGLVDPEMF